MVYFKSVILVVRLSWSLLLVHQKVFNDLFVFVVIAFGAPKAVFALFIVIIKAKTKKYLPESHLIGVCDTSHTTHHT